MKQSDKILRTAPLPAILRSLNPKFSYCSKCGLPWNCCTSKTVKTTKSAGTFATCDFCWDNSTLEELKECYTKTYKNQKKSLNEFNISGGTKHKMNHTLKHLLKCVEDEYNGKSKYKLY